MELLIFLVIAFMGSFFGAYIKRKGDNLATREDIQGITKEVESIKTSLQSQLYIHQRRYEKEFEILSDLSKKLVFFRNCVTALAVSGDSSGESGLKSLKNDLDKSFKTLNDTAEYFQPFYSRKIFTLIKNLESGCNTLINCDIKSFDDEQRFLKDIVDPNNKIWDLTDMIRDGIRDRVKEWENL